LGSYPRIVFKLKTAEQLCAYFVGCLLLFQKLDLQVRGFLSSGVTDAARRHLTQQSGRLQMSEMRAQRDIRQVSISRARWA
jgi:hypothetical protein